MPVERRQQIIDEFEAMPAGSVLPAQIGAGGTGLNIQAASVVILCEPQLKPSTENQAIARAHRMGQSRTVLVYRLIAADTIDERIQDMLREKQAIFDAFADKSAAADATSREESQIDDKTLGKLILDEIDRINAKNGKAAPVPVDIEQTAEKPSPAQTSRSVDIASSKQNRAETENRYITTMPASAVDVFSSIDDFAEYLANEGIEHKDNRPKNGCLWIPADALPNAETVRIDGSRLKYSKASKALKGAAGWYIS